MKKRKISKARRRLRHMVPARFASIVAPLPTGHAYVQKARLVSAAKYNYATKKHAKAVSNLDNLLISNDPPLFSVKEIQSELRQEADSLDSLLTRVRESFNFYKEVSDQLSTHLTETIEHMRILAEDEETLAEIAVDSLTADPEDAVPDPGAKNPQNVRALLTKATKGTFERKNTTSTPLRRVG